MRTPKKNWLTRLLAIVLLCTMALKVSVTLISHFRAGNDSFSIEKNAEEGKDTKEESSSKGDKKLLFSGRLLADHIFYSTIGFPKPVCRYKLRDVAQPIRSVPTPPPDQLG